MEILVALRKESVDRNNWIRGSYTIDSKSLSARRAWIEIIVLGIENSLVSVALRKESVDRNNERI